MTWHPVGRASCMGSALHIAAGLALCGTASTLGQEPPASDTPMAEVFVIGTVHAPRGLLLESSYSAAHLRAVLDRFRPTIIGVEATPLAHAWGLSRYATWEIDHVVVPWAAPRGVPVYGVDWEDLETAVASARRWIGALRGSDTQPPRTLAQAHADAVRVAGMIQRSLGGDTADPENAHRHDWFTWINSGTRDTAAAVRAFWESASREDAQGRAARALGARDDRIVHQVITLIRRYPDARVAILIGFSHKPDLDRKLARVPGIRMVQVRDSLRITLEDLARAWAPEDAVRTLAESVNGNAYYFNPAGVDTARTGRALDALRARGVGTPDVVYLEARSLMARGRMDEASAALERVAADPAAVTPFPLGPYEPLLPLAALARLELGKLHDLRGARGAAVTEYRHVAAALDALRPEVPPDSTFPTPTDWGTAARAAAARIAAYQAAREIVDMLLREPWTIRGR